MKQRISHIAIIVKDYDEAIEFYTKKLDFTLLEDSKINEKKRWVLVAAPGSNECSVLLAKAANEEQRKYIGNQTGGRVFIFLFTDDISRDYNKLTKRNVRFVRPPTNYDYGIVAVFEDLYGNLWDLIEPNENNRGFTRNDSNKSSDIP